MFKEIEYSTPDKHARKQDTVLPKLDSSLPVNVMTHNASKSNFVTHNVLFRVITW